MGFAHRFNAPIVLLSTVGSNLWTNYLLANPASPSFVPTIYLPFSSRMSFFQRAQNTVTYAFEQLYKHSYVLPQQNKRMKKHFPKSPELDQLLYDASLILLNSHPSMSEPVPHVPNMIEIGGFHVKPAKELPQEIEMFLDSAEDGVIYFSMGSNIKSSMLSAEKRDAIFRSFSKLKQKILWKWESDEMPGKPDNVRVGKWLPQQDILAHKNVKAFITHGGILSTIEAIYHGIPVIGIPIYGDQKMNVQIAVQSGYAVLVPYQEISEEKLTWAFDEILGNPKYRDNARKRSQIMRDQPVPPLDNAMYWIEYVIRFGGAKHFRSAVLDLSWYQYLLLDVVAFIILSMILLVAVGRLCLGRLFASCRRQRLDSGKKSN